MTYWKHLEICMIVFGALPLFSCALFIMTQKSDIG